MDNKENNKKDYYYKGILELYFVLKEKDKVYPEVNMRRMFTCKIECDSDSQTSKKKILKEQLIKLSTEYLDNLNQLNPQTRTQRHYERLNEIKLVKYHRIPAKEYIMDFIFASYLFY